MRRALGRWLPGTARICLALLAIAVAAGAIAVAESPGRNTTYAGRLPMAAALTAVAGLALVAAGLLTSLGQPRGPVGGLAVLAGLTWFAPVWVAWQGGPPLVPSLAMMFAGITLALVFQLVAVFSSGRARRGPVRVLVLGIYAEAIVVAIALALFRDPYFDPGCFANCDVNAFVVRSLPSVARTVQSIDRWFVALASVALAVIATSLLWAGSRVVRRTVAPVALAGIAFAAATFIRILEIGRVTVEDPSNDVLFASFVIESLALVLLAAGLIAVVVRARTQRVAVARIVTDLDQTPAPGSLHSALASALGDPELRIAYRLSADDRHVNADGNLVDLGSPTAGRAGTRLVRNDRTIAVISHAGGVAVLERELGPAVRLALENERLQAELLFELEQLRSSRARIVEAGDRERRTLERDLHDGAQQRLLALSYDIRLARAKAERNGDPQAGQLLTRAVIQTQEALEELRDVAHGIYPAVLAEAGLASALATLADASPIALELRADDGRYPAPIETSAYFTIAEIVDDAVRRNARHASVSVAREDGMLVVSIEEDGAERTAPMTAVTDRVGALGGEVEVGATACRLEIPCE